MLIPSCDTIYDTLALPGVPSDETNAEWLSLQNDIVRSGNTEMAFTLFDSIAMFVIHLIMSD
jgi:hypothetical protein